MYWGIFWGKYQESWGSPGKRLTSFNRPVPVALITPVCKSGICADHATPDKNAEFNYPFYHQE